MKTIKSMLITAVAFLGLTSVVSAVSLNGLYLETGASAVGVELEGSSTDVTGSTTVGSLGDTAIVFSYGAGYMTPRSNKFGLDFGVMLTPGEAKIKGTSDSAVTDVTLEVSDSSEYYLAPMINITEEASLYLKYGWNSADLKVTGDVTKPTDMDGTTVALGTVMSWGSNLYIRTEAGMTEYDKITVTGLGTSISSTSTVTARPNVNYGKIAIGYKF